MSMILIEFDGGCRPTNPGNKYGSYSVKEDGSEVLRKSRVEFGRGTNNEAEWNSLELALTDTLKVFTDAGAPPSTYQLKVVTDSMILRNRLVGKNRAKVWKKSSESSNRMIALANKCLDKLEQFASFEVVWQSRERNVENFGH